MKKSVWIGTGVGLIIVFGSTAKVFACQAKWEYINRLALEMDLQGPQIAGAWKNKDAKKYCQLMAQRQALAKYIVTGINSAIACQGVAYPDQLAYRDNAVKNKSQADNLAQKYCK
jgi:hypothetical protein